jgi:hypothetical protein
VQCATSQKCLYREYRSDDDSARVGRGFWKVWIAGTPRKHEINLIWNHLATASLDQNLKPAAHTCCDHWQASFSAPQWPRPTALLSAHRAPAQTATQRAPLPIWRLCACRQASPCSYRQVNPNPTSDKEDHQLMASPIFTCQVSTVTGLLLEVSKSAAHPCLHGPAGSPGTYQTWTASGFWNLADLRNRRSDLRYLYITIS